MVHADIYTLHESDFYRILEFKCRCTDCQTSKPEYSGSFAISYVRKGNFLFNVFRNSLDSYNGCVLITKPGYERTVTHVHTVPDECIIIDFKNQFYQELQQQYGKTSFFRNNDLHSTLIHASAELEFLYLHILQLLQNGSPMKLQMDDLVLEIVAKTLACVTDYRPNNRIHTRLKKNHLVTIERAKEYIAENFVRDVSLTEMAMHCYVSPFHFSRIFKAFTSSSPHQFLRSVRLKNAEVLLRNTTSPIADVAFSSGFSSIEHFTVAFHSKYNYSPSKFRASKRGTAFRF